LSQDAIAKAAKDNAPAIMNAIDNLVRQCKDAGISTPFEIKRLLIILRAKLEKEILEQ
jgi:hypothetical protein